MIRKYGSLVVVAGLVAALFLLAVPRSSTANLLVNPGFEIGIASGATPDAWWKYDQTGQESWAPRTGTNGMAFWAWGNGVWGGFGQDVSTNMLMGEIVTFSIWGLAEANYMSTTPETWLAIEWWTNGASTWTKQDKVEYYSELTAVRDTWTNLTLIRTNTLNNVNMIKPIVGFGGGTNRSLPSQSAKWDDADLTIIPEPTIAGLLGFAGLLFVAMRRMTRK